MFDLLIKNATIADGLGSPLRAGALAILGGKIVALGDIQGEAKETFDASGLILAPGFINAHSHADMVCEETPELLSDIEQGITTQIAGNCGIGAAPMTQEKIDACASVTRMLTDFDFASSLNKRKTYADYFNGLKKKSYGTHLAILASHGSIRCAVMGLENRKTTPDEINRMCALLKEAMQEGAKGISFGLEYPPGCFADGEELTALAKVVVPFNGVITAHIRNEDDSFIQAVTEMIAIARASKATLVLSHHKAIYGRNWGKTKESLRLIENARQEGLEVYCDQYPYLAASTGLKSRLPSRLFSLGDETIVKLLEDEEECARLRSEILGPLSLEDKFGETMIGNSPSHPEFNGKYLIALAKEKGLDPVALLLKILHDDKLTTNGIFTYMTPDDVNRVMTYAYTMMGTDGLFRPKAGSAHPRAFGSFPRVLGRYVREEKVLSLTEAIRKMTSLPAKVYGLKGKGSLQVGMDADLVLFDPKTIKDNATFNHFNAKNEGIHRVYVMGKLVLDNGKGNGVCAGTIL